MEKRLKQLLNYGINCKHEILLTLIWVGFLGVCFEVAGGGGRVKLPPLSKTFYNYARNFKFGT